MPAIELTPEQQHIITAQPGHYVITAVAGSGKTTTLAYRIRHLLAQGIDSRRLLVLMFNRAAQQDFTRKLNAILPPSQPRPEVRTFHAMAYRLYQRFVHDGHLAPFKRNILSDKEAQYQLWRLAMTIVEPDALAELKRNKKEHLELALQFFDAIKAQLDTPEIVFEQSGLEPKFRYFLSLFDAFEAWRKQHARISYADMLYDTVRAIEAKPELAQLVGNKMDMVLVDEYQDTNDIQHTLLKQIAGQRAQVTVVGDPDQTIYEFRGAKPEYMLSGFAQDFPNAKALNLSYSFRYGHQISLLANHLIARNHARQDTLCKSHRYNPRSEIHLHRHEQETQAFLDLIKSATLADLEQSAVLVRTWSQTVSFELALLEHAMPYQMDRYKGVFGSAEYQAIQSLLELASGQFPSFSPTQRHTKLQQLFRFPHVGLPEAELERLGQHLATHEQHWGRQLLTIMPSGLKKIQSVKLQRLAKALSRIENSKANIRTLLLDYINETELYEGIRSLSLNHDSAEEKIAATKAIFSFVLQQSGQISEVLQHLNTLRQTAEQQQQGGILLSTIHRAKGLEWQTVYVPGFNDRNYPYHLSSKSLDRAVEESERRLFYVAMTRAKQCLHLFASSAQPSRFERELNSQQSIQLGRNLDSHSDSATLTTLRPPSAIIKRYAELFSCSLSHKPPKGTVDDPLAAPVWSCQTIEHLVFGKGEVIEEGQGSFTVKFSDQQQRVFSKETAAKFFAEA